MIPLAFQGGTALRFLFGLPRFSEDLDFALEAGAAPFPADSVEDRIKGQLRREGYEVVTRGKVDRVVENILISFPGLLFEAGLSPHEAQRLSIRIDVDTKPPAGASLTSTIVRRHALLNPPRHDGPFPPGREAPCDPPARVGRGPRPLRSLFWYLSDAELDSDQPRSLEQRSQTNRLGGTGSGRCHLETCGGRPVGGHGLGCCGTGRFTLSRAWPRHRALWEREPPENAGEIAWGCGSGMI